jgi:hypothetical protein
VIGFGFHGGYGPFRYGNRKIGGAEQEIVAWDGASAIECC